MSSTNLPLFLFSHTWVFFVCLFRHCTGCVAERKQQSRKASGVGWGWSGSVRSWGAEKQINRGFKRTEAKDEKREVSSAFVLFPSALALCCVVKYTAIC